MPEPDLSDNQVRLMLALRRSPTGEATTRELGLVKDATRTALGVDRARKTMGRLEDRKLTGGAGSGSTRKWWLTGEGKDALNAVRPEREANGAPKRPYHIFRYLTGTSEIKLADLLESLGPDAEVLVKVGTLEAHNTANAYRAAGRDREMFPEPGTPKLVAVADRMFQPQDVPIEEGERRVGV